MQDEKKNPIPNMRYKNKNSCLIPWKYSSSSFPQNVYIFGMFMLDGKK